MIHKSIGGKKRVRIVTIKEKLKTLLPKSAASWFIVDIYMMLLTGVYFSLDAIKHH